MDADLELPIRHRSEALSESQGSQRRFGTHALQWVAHGPEGGSASETGGASFCSCLLLKVPSDSEDFELFPTKEKG